MTVEQLVCEARQLPREQAAELREKGPRPDLRTASAYGTNFLTLMCRPTVPKRMGGGDCTNERIPGTWFICFDSSASSGTRWVTSARLRV